LQPRVIHAAKVSPTVAPNKQPLHDMVRIWRPAILILTPCLSVTVFGHIIEVLASQKECFFEDLHVNDKVNISLVVQATNILMFAIQMTVTYQVGGGGNLDIDFWVGSCASTQMFL
jgi:p24 family protein beta-1